MSSTPGLPDIGSDPDSPPPVGTIPNFSHPESRQDMIYIAAGVCLPLMVIFAIVRSYVKLLVIRMRTWDDCMASFLAFETFQLR